MDFFSIITEVHPSLIDSTHGQLKSISNETLSRLAKTVLMLKDDKKQRLQKAEVEVERLDQLKFSRMKKIAFKKQAELEEIYAHAHKEIDAEAAREKTLALDDWMSACEEDSWLKRLTFIKGYWKEPYFCISSSSKFALGEFSILGSELLTLYCCNLM